MGRLLRLSALACCLLATGCGSNPGSTTGTNGPSVKSQPAGAAWQTFRAPDGSFAVSFPGTGEQLPGSTAEEPRFGVEIEGQGGYTVLFAGYDEVKPEDLDGHLETMRNNAVDKNKVLFDEKSKVGDLPARDFAFVDEDGDAQFYRVLIAGNRLYQLTRVVNEKDFAADKANREKFVNSFELTDKK